MFSDKPPAALAALIGVIGFLCASTASAEGGQVAENNPIGDPSEETYLNPYANTAGTTSTFAGDVNVAPSSCKAPFLDQAFPMYFHENYVMNPSDNIPTWVICGLTFDNDIIDVAGQTTIGVVGSEMAGASAELPQCFFTVHSVFNTTQFPYRTGNNLIYSTALTLTRDNADQWVAVRNVSYSQVAAAVGPDPDYWVATAWCRLPSGHSVSGIVVTDDG